MAKKVKFLTELNQTLDDCNLQAFARLVRKHPLNELKINSNVSREEIFNYLRRVPVEILSEVYEENFIDEDSEEEEDVEDEELEDDEDEDELEAEEDDSEEDLEEELDDESED